MTARNNKGFTLVEILVGLAVSGLVLTAVYKIYVSQQKVYVVQKEVANMQQNLRVAMFMMVSEARMAGYDPTGNAGAGIVSVTTAPHSIRFTKDTSGNGSIAESGEDVTYSLYTDANGIQKLGRKNPTLNQPVAQNIDALDLVYLDEDNAVIASPAANINDIRSVQITLVARSTRSEQNYTNNFIYRNQQGTTILGPAGDNVRRSILTKQVKFRNIGL